MAKKISLELTRAVIDALGGPAAVARRCRIKSPSVTEWKQSGMPTAREDFLRAIHPEVFESCERFLSIHECSPAAGVRQRMEGKPTSAQ